jgi:hypothetical protein
MVAKNPSPYRSALYYRTGSVADARQQRSDRRAVHLYGNYVYLVRVRHGWQSTILWADGPEFRPTCQTVKETILDALNVIGNTRFTIME